METQESPPRQHKRPRWESGSDQELSHDNDRTPIGSRLHDSVIESEASYSTQPSMSLRVSSSVLTLVSPVFSRMLSGHLAEGVAFRTTNSPRPFPIALPDDDGAAFTILANIAHHRSDQIPSNPLTSELLELALLADKYDCANLLSAHGIIWLQRKLSIYDTRNLDRLSFIPDEMLQLCHMLLFAYTINLPEQFAECSWQILLLHSQSVKSEVEDGFDLPIHPDHELLRHDIHCKCSMWRTMEWLWTNIM